MPGNSAVKAISLLLSKGVQEANIIFLNLISVSLGTPRTSPLSELKFFHFIAKVLFYNLVHLVCEGEMFKCRETKLNFCQSTGVSCERTSRFKIHKT